MTGTDTGGMRGLPPTERAVALDGADLIRAADEGVAEVRGFFDGGAIPRQLGMQVVVQPDQAGPFRFGTSVWASHGTGEPGAVSLTVLEATSAGCRRRCGSAPGHRGEPDGGARVPQRPARLVGRRMYTISAWETPEDIERLREGPHADALRWFFGNEVAIGAQTGVWAPHRLNGMWVRCADCGEMVHADGGRCAAGHELPAAPAYW